MTRKLSLKQKKFIQEYLKSGNGTKAALNVYDTTDANVAHAIASENLRKPTISDSIEKHLQAEGYTPQDSVRRIIANAEAGVGVKATASDSLRADELLLKLTGHLVHKQQTISVNYDIDSMSNNEVLSLKNKLKKMRSERKIV